MRAVSVFDARTSVCTVSLRVNRCSRRSRIPESAADASSADEQSIVAVLHGLVQVLGPGIYDQFADLRGRVLKGDRNGRGLPGINGFPIKADDEERLRAICREELCLCGLEGGIGELVKPGFSGRAQSRRRTGLSHRKDAAVVPRRQTHLSSSTASSTLAASARLSRYCSASGSSMNSRRLPAMEVSSVRTSVGVA